MFPRDIFIPANIINFHAETSAFVKQNIILEHCSRQEMHFAHHQLLIDKDRNPEHSYSKIYSACHKSHQ